MIDKTKPIVALFDLDGVVIDTENQYSFFWENVCNEYLGDKEIAHKVKGQTLYDIFEKFFPNMEKEKKEIDEKLNIFEASMQMNYIAGVIDFIKELKKNNFRTALVTSSTDLKMNSVLKNHPELNSLFEKILTAEMFAHSKPAPDPYLLGAKVFNTIADNCFVFEDSFNGLKSGCAAKMTVIGVATTNSAQAIAPYANLVIPDFSALTIEQIMQLKK